VRSALSGAKAIDEVKAEPVPKRRQTIDFPVPDHDRLKRIAFEHGTDVGPMLRALALKTTDEEYVELLRSVDQ